MYFGFSGKEKALNINLTETQNGLLLALAAHNRGFEFSSLVDGVILQPFGWVEVDNLLLKNDLMELASLFKNTEFVVENRQDRLFRFSVHPDVLFFDDGLFAYCVNQKDLDSRETWISIRLIRDVINTPLGNVAHQTEDFSVKRTLAVGLHKLARENYTVDNLKNLYKTFRKDARLSALGLKNLVNDEDKNIKFCICYVLN